MKIGILSLQGAFVEHKYVLDNLGIENFEIRKLSNLNENFNGMIIPGGESTAIGKLLVDLDLLEPIKKRIIKGMPVFGTCAGSILLAKNVINTPPKHSFATMDIEIKRNAYGRQLGSFIKQEKFNDIDIPMSFIRAPLITNVGKGTIIAKVNGGIVAAVEGNQLVTTFHPELKTDIVHKYFINMINPQYSI